MHSVQRNRAIRISIAIAIGLVAIIVGVLFTYLIVTAQHRDRVTMAYEASRAASLVFEAYDYAGTVDGDMLPRAVEGFAVYDVNGNSLYQYGTAPAVLSPEHSLLQVPGKTVLREDVLRIVRPVGTLEVLRSLPRGTEELRSPAPPRGHSGGVQPNRPQAVLLDYNVSAHVQRSSLRSYAWFGAAFLVVVLGALLFALSRRLRRYEDEAERQSRLVQLGQAARTLTHEIKNPLGAIKLQVAILKRELSENHNETLSVLDEELNRINNLVERVRDFLHSSPGQPQELDLVEVANELPDRFEFPVVVQAPNEPTTITADPERLRSVLNNLIQNAHESMQESDGEAPVEVTIRKQKGDIVIDVDDRGPGIPAEERARIFDPFYTTKPRGSGVGLAITKQFVDTMNGSIQVLDLPEGGTRIRVILR